MSENAIRVEGLREFQRALRSMDNDLPKQIRVILNDATGIVVAYAQPRIPRKTGRAAASVKARSSQREARVAVGGNRAPYYPWLDFGGQGRVAGRPAPRPFIREGRYLYPALTVKRQEVTDVMSRGIAALAERAGLEVT